MGLPEVKTVTFQLIVRIYRVEIAPFMLARPDAYVRVSFAGDEHG